MNVYLTITLQEEDYDTQERPKPFTVTDMVHGADLARIQHQGDRENLVTGCLSNLAMAVVEELKKRGTI
jgi:hypothetical protein